MNNKVLIEEINRVREVMGLPVMAPPNRPKVILEVVSPGYLKKILAILTGGKYAHKGLAKIIVVKGGPIETLLTKNDDFFWKVKNKYSDELTDVNTMDELLDRLIDAPNSITTKNIMRDLFMDNPETRALIANAADNLVPGGLSKLDNIAEIEMFLANMDELGIPIDADDLAKVADDIFLKSADNPIRVAFKNSGTVSKNLFGKRKKKWWGGTKQTSTRIEKGNVVIDVMVDQGVKTSDDAYEFMLKIGMNEADAAKVKIAIEKGVTVGDDIAEEIFEKIAKTADNELNLIFVDKIGKNKYLVNKIQTGGKNGKMTPEEIRTFLNLGTDVKNSVLLDISDVVGTLKVRNIFKRSEISVGDMVVNNQAWWYPTYLRRKILAGMSFGYKGLYGFLTTVNFLFWFYHIIPSVYEAKEDSHPWLKLLFGTEGGGTFDCENNIECVLNPTAENMSKVKRPDYVNIYLENDAGVISTLYAEAAKYIGKQLGTYTTEGDNPGWFTEGSLDNFSPPNSVDESAILNKLNERNSLFGILRVATDYYDATSRQLWDDCDLMSLTPGSYSEFLSTKWAGMLKKIPIWNPDFTDTTKDILRGLMSKPQRTVQDSNVTSVNTDPRDVYLALFEFPKTLFLEKDNGDIERWKCCYKGPMPQQWTAEMSSLKEIGSEQDFKNMSPTDFNILYKKYAAEKYQTKKNAYMRPEAEKEIDGVKQKVYNHKGQTECGAPQMLEGMAYEEMKKKMTDEMKDFMNLLGSGNNNKPPIKEGQPNT